MIPNTVDEFIRCPIEPASPAANSSSSITATPTGKSFAIDGRRSQQTHDFKRIGIHSLPGHFRKMEKDLLKSLYLKGADESAATDLVEAEDILASDTIFKKQVVQRSRAYVRESN